MSKRSRFGVTIGRVAGSIRRFPGLPKTMYASLLFSLLPLASCGDGSPTDLGVTPPDAPPAEAVYPSPGGVDDLRVERVSDTSVTLTWVQVDDGTGRPANYRMKYAAPAIDWRSATIGCQSTIQGTEIGATMSCTVEGLTPATDYDFLMMSFRLVNGAWAGAKYSNVSSARTAVPASSRTSVDDLAVTELDSSSVTLAWTQVDDGTGSPALYRLKYANPTIEDWRTSTIGCAPTIRGDGIGTTISCTVEGLEASTAYEFQLMSYRIEENGSWAGARYSNKAQGETATPGDSIVEPDPDSIVVPDPPPPTQGSISGGIWIDREDLMRLPTSGPAWDALRADAGRDPGIADISDQDSNHDVYTMAAALVCARTGEYCAKARDGVVDAIGTEAGARWLAVGRNLAAYVIAADLLRLRSDGNPSSAGTRVEEWIASWLTKSLRNNNDPSLRGFGPFHASANAAAQEGFAYAAVAAYLGNERALQRAWDAYRTFACDPSAPDHENIFMDPPVRDGWTHDDENPCGVNPAGTTKRVPAGLPGAGSTRRIDGALVGDMRRGGVYQWEPGFTQYPWVGLEGFVPAAVILERAGFPAFEVADRAVLRAHEYLWYLRQQTGDTRWFDGDRARELIHLVNTVYGRSFPVNGPTGRGRTVGYTGWTHP